jgi:hypothetical protein
VEKWYAARKNLGLKAQFKIKEQSRQKFRKEGKEEFRAKVTRKRKKPNDRSERKKFKHDRTERRPSVKPEDIDPSEF